MGLGRSAQLAENLEWHRNSRLALHIRELRPGVAVETAEATVVDGGFFVPVRPPGRQKLKKMSLHAEESPTSFVLCASRIVGRVKTSDLRMGQVNAFAASAVLAWTLIFGGNLSAATVPFGFTETVISGLWTNAVGTAFENNRAHVISSVDL